MGKIICVMGKSAIGKDTIRERLFEDPSLQLHTIVPYTTRPIRSNEEEGGEYHFVDEDRYQEMKRQGLIVEERAYNTVHGLWRYFTAKDESLNLDAADYLLVGTLEAYEGLCAYFGKEKVVPVLIDLEDGERLSRALKREKKQAQPKYQELCRRFLADSEDFSEEKIAKAGITKRFYNDVLETCLSEIHQYLSEQGVG